MSRPARLLLFAAGLLVYAALLRAVGLATLLEQVRRSGWMLLPVVGVYALVYVCYTVAWRCVLAGEPHRPTFTESYAINVTSFTLNYITPFVNAGGEPYRVAASAPWLGTRRATGTTILYYLVHSLSSCALWLAGLATALIVLPRTTWHLSGIVLLALVVTAFAALVLAVYRYGGLERLLDLLRRAPLLRRASPWLERHRSGIVEIDLQLRRFWHEHPRHFLAAVAIDCVGRALHVFEMWLICRSVAVPVSYGEALFVSGLTALALNAFFFMPFELGSKEGSLVGLFAALGYPVPLAVYASVVSRLRELVWIGIGLALMWAAPRRRDGPTGRRTRARPASGASPPSRSQA